MITNNGAVIFSTQFEGATGTRQLTDTGGASSTPNYSTSALYLGANMQTFPNDKGACMILGVGDAEPQKTDYFLDETEVDGVDISEAIPCVSARKSITPNGNTVFTATYQNTSNRAYTIKEIGIIQQTYTSAVYLVARTLIPPRTIQPNETVTFSYVIQFG